MQGDILTKWLSLRTLSNPGGLGCPFEEERDAVGVARAQGFEQGRVYAKLPGVAPPGTAYVPAVFVNALQKRGDEGANGLPLADPTDLVGLAMQTWLFQRWARPNQTELPSTLEIRGSPLHTVDGTTGRSLVFAGAGTLRRRQSPKSIRGYALGKLSM